MLQKTADWIYRYILFFLPEGEPHPWDYVAHFIVSFTGVGILFLIILFLLKPLDVPPIIALFISAVVMLVIGIIKEISDYNLGKTDMAGDMLADIFGIVAVMVFIFVLARLTN